MSEQLHQPVLDGAAAEVDERLAALDQSMRFLLDVTPVDAAEHRAAWLRGDHDEPAFTYRPLSTEPEVVLAALDGIDVSAVEDENVAALLAGKHRELALQARMLAARNTPDFLQLSLELFGPVAPSLRDKALQVLESVPLEKAEPDPVGSADFLRRAASEIAWYTAQDPDVVMHAEVRADVSGVMVSGDTLLVPEGNPVQRNRVDALLQHEVGTHLVTQVNGAVQPLRCMAGLAGYDETQEGLAVLAEAAVGQLTATRLRQLAGRVLVVDAMLDGATFADCWQQLVSRGTKPGSAFTTVMRVFRGGGLTKDACYLRGVVALLDHLAGGGSLEPLVLGKFALADLDRIEALAADGLLHPARIRPHWMTDEALARLHDAAHQPLSALVA